MKQSTKLQITGQLQSIERQIGELHELLEKDENCLSLIQLSQIIQTTLAKVDAHILEGHLKSCVKEHLTDENAEAKVKEVINSFKNLPSE